MIHAYFCIHLSWCHTHVQTMLALTFYLSPSHSTGVIIQMTQPVGGILGVVFEWGLTCYVFTSRCIKFSRKRLMVTHQMRFSTLVGAMINLFSVWNIYILFMAPRIKMIVNVPLTLARNSKTNVFCCRRQSRFFKRRWWCSHRSATTTASRTSPTACHQMAPLTAFPCRRPSARTGRRNWGSRQYW